MPLSHEADILHVISDLHLGGKEGFQIFRCGQEFETFSHALCAEAASARVHLVVNGDFVDFLAEHPAECFSVYHAEEKLRRILADPSFQKVTTGLRRLLSHPNVTVAFNLGNHDLELALPWIGRALADILTEGEAGRASRLVLAFDGVGIRCKVGSADILCLHGNEVDAWNVTDHEAIRKIARDTTQGLAVAEWVPNAGTQLVITAMNEIKKRYPFVDLLKPEREAVLPILAMLDVSFISSASSFVATLPRRATDDVRMRVKWLGDEGNEALSNEPLRSLRLQGAGRVVAAQVMMEQAEERFQAGVKAADLVDQREQALGLGNALWASLRRRPRSEILRQALDGLDADRSFDPQAEDATYREIDARIGPSIDFVVTGHTHLRRALRRKHGTGWYYNTGTWAALMQIPADLRQSPDAFGDFIDGLANDDMARLETKGLLRREPTIASFWTDDGRTHGELRRVSISGPPLVAVPGTHSKAP